MVRALAAIIKTRIVIIIITLTVVAACRTSQEFYICGLARSIVIDPELDLYSFDGFIAKESNKPFAAISLDTQRVYSPNYKFYFEYQTFKDPAKRKVILYSTDRKPISTLKHLPKGATLLWLDNCVILNGGSAPITEKTVIDLRTGRVKTYSTNGWFIFLGQTHNIAFFASSSESCKVAGRTIKNRHSIISIDENGVNLVVDNVSIGNSYPDSVYFYEFFNSKFAIRSLKLQNKSDDDKPLKTEFISENKVVLAPDSITFFTAYEDSYFANGCTYIKVNGGEIYRVTEDSFEKVFDFREAKINGWIKDFKIEGEYLIFKTQNSRIEFAFMDPPKDSIITVNGLIARQRNYGYNTIGVVNLKTKECVYPAIK
ncbi:MAG: hypothetical protein WC150_10955 [Bacteroidia bacterium]